MFVTIYQFLEKRKYLTYSIFIGFLIAFALLASRLHLSTDISKMLPVENQQRDIQSFFLHNKSFDKIIVSVNLRDTQTTHPDLLTQYATEFTTILQQLDTTNLIKQIELQQDENQMMQLMDAIQHNIPFLLTEKDYAYLYKHLQTDSIAHHLQENYRMLSSPNGIILKQLIQNDPLGITWPVFKRLQQLNVDDNQFLYDGYLMSTDEKNLTFFIYTTHPAGETDANKNLHKLLKQTQLQLSTDSNFKAVESYCFGGQLVAAGNAAQMQSDTFITLSITLILFIALFIFFFRTVWSPLQVMLPVIFGGLFSLAMMAVLFGRMSMMALGASSVILGIAVNYAIHFLAHYRHSKNKIVTIADLTQPMTIGSFTTIAAFVSLNFMHAPVLRELGLFTAFSLIGSAICTLVFMPHFTPAHTDNAQKNFIDRWASYPLYKNKWFIIGMVSISAILSYFAPSVSFNQDLMTMNYMSPDVQQAQRVIQQRNAASLNNMFLISEGDNLTTVIHQHQQQLHYLDSLKNVGIIKQYNDVSAWLLTPEIIHERLNLWKQFTTYLSTQKILEKSIQAGNRTGFSYEAFEGLTTMLQKNYEAPDRQLSTLLNPITSNFIQTENGIIKLFSLAKTTQQNREQIFSVFPLTHSTYAIDKQMITSQLVAFIKDDFYRIVLFTSCIVFFTILLTYGRIEIALISFVPMFITWLCILGLMTVFGIQFNIINVIISTLIFGLGDDYSIFVTDGLIEKYKKGSQKIDSTRTAILLSAITTIIGLGVLMIAKHPALRSIAWVSVIGIISIVLISQTIQPLLFNFFIQHRANKKLHPFTLWSFLKTIFAFTYYVLGCILVTLIGFLLTKCIPFAKDKMKYAYHVVISKMMWSLLYIMGNTRKQFFDKHQLNFDKPSVIIANHASFLDLLRIISLHPKILLMTNQWVWRSPVFGALVRMADYYPVEEGAEFSIDKLQYWVNRGYSIAVFPEGTRSYTDTIHRFKKGAFYVAEKLQLDIQPVIFHGIGYTMQKGDFLLKDGEINVYCLPRIAANDMQWGNDFVSRTKSISKYFKQEFAKFKQTRENTAYFREQLVKNYIYKGPVIEWYARIKTKLEHNYEAIEKLIPVSGKIADIGCGYGFLSYMLSFTSSARNIIGLDYDEEKIAVAQHNFSANNQLQFKAVDITQYSFESNFDAIIILDVLHYLLPEAQIELLQRCAQHLLPGGVIIVRDGWANLQQKHKGTVLTEIFSTRLFGFNKTQNKLHFITENVLQNFARTHHLQMRIIDDTRFTSNVTTIFSKHV